MNKYENVKNVAGKPKEKKYGVVSNCVRLNLRRLPTKESNVITVVNFGTRLRVEALPDNNEWLKVWTVSGVECYACAEYITIE